MKRYYLFVIIGVVCFNLTAQNRVIDTHAKELTPERLNIAQHPSFKLPGDQIYYSPLDAWAVSEMITQLWDNSAWLNMAKTNYFYGANGLPTNDMNYSWSGTDWGDNTRTTYTYNSNNLLELALTENWDGNAWVDQYRYSYTYNGQNKVLTWMAEGYNAGVWEKSSLYTYTYTGNNLTELLTQNWDGSAWVNYIKTTNEFNGLNLRTSSVTQMWVAGAWLNISKSINTYNSNNLLSFELEQSWAASAWADKSRSTYTYNSNNKMELNFTENYVSNAWVNHSQVLYTYDGDGNNIESLDQTWNSGAWENFFKLTMSYIWTTDVANNELPVSEFKLMNNYPNPFNPVTTINYSISKAANTKITVYNIIGSKVAVIFDEYKPVGNYSVQFNAASLPSGVYFYKLESGSYAAIKKFVLMK